ncbi:diaminopimelate epimerase [Pelosinus sp. IPA-1]|uniref:diaminopimelate epimerase n=1 Tax=Pelosinus sp. IPA-1 TaxID=3029569 RepID=UPI0024362740|nr:diaminopimelate epimerase [Pelosinus sp. IPA-1]GMB00017.1 diaminopimelate epimerase [Pelosinus sp. IPA-1]
MKFDYAKYHALGNDYIVIDPQIKDIPLTKEVIELICHRNFGVGSDGILYGPILEDGQFRLRIFNPDGSEAEKSGNGIRIFSRYLFDTGYLSSDDFLINTLGGVVKVKILNNNASLIQVDMGKATFTSSKIPVAGAVREVINESFAIDGHEFKITCVSVGNPHCVILQDEVSKSLAEKFGSLIETNELFPNRINVQFMKVIDSNNIQIEIWERGAGYTLASGSSSSASASAAYRLGLTENKVSVHMQGGVIDILIDSDGHIHMTGSVTSVSKGVFSSDLRQQICE